jgi:hypothetical protein
MDMAVECEKVLIKLDMAKEDEEPPLSPFWGSKTKNFH